MSKAVHYGGSFAPPVDDTTLELYAQLAEGADRRIKGYMTDLIKMMRVFRETPESRHPRRPGPKGFPMIPLEQAEVERIWDVVPWPEECDVIGKVFDALPDGDLRNAAYHLLWFARELAVDREPLTNDKL